MTCDKFKEFFKKFDVVYAKLKQRDKALQLFKHYHEKLKDLKEKHLVNTSSIARDPTKLAKEE